METPTKLSPKDCESESDVCRLETTSVEVGNVRMLITDGQYVHFIEQEEGEPPRASIDIPKRVFYEMLRWYNEEQTTT
jgi:hypothetical protein